MNAAAPPGPTPPPLAARALAFAALAAFGALHWANLVAPGAPGRALLTLAVAIGTALAMVACARLPRRPRLALAGAVALAAALLGLAAAGAPLRLLAPSQWGALASGVGEGLDALPDAPVPYAGADEWARFAILAGGALLMSIAALAAFWTRAGRRSRAIALLALVTLYGVPAAELHADGELGRGAVFALLLVAFVWLERMRLRDARAGVLLACAAVGVGLALAPAIDPAKPWLNYESLAERLAPAAGATFSWDHDYGPYDWPRDGRVLLRVHAAHGAYWKTENLDSFDGLRWRRSSVLGSQRATGELPGGGPAPRRWVQRILVSVRSLRSRDFVGAGTTLFVERAGIGALTGGSPGTYVAARALKRGDAYVAHVYVPRPTDAQLAADRSPYPDFASVYRTLTVPLDVRHLRGFRADVQFAPFGDAARPEAVLQGVVPRNVRGLLARSPYAGAWDLSRRLAARSRSPYEYVRNVQDLLANRFRYSETPPVRGVPLEAFLFRDRVGYCQHFSGAMALLLRMGGVPARVATGFTTGTYDRARGDYVVRDFDAHSWVEAYFSRYGWVTFDPTPTVAPARAQALPGGTRPRTPSPADLSGDPTREAAARARGSPIDVGLVAAAAALVAMVALAGGSLVVARRRRGAPPDALLWELERALRRSGRATLPGITLRALERRFGDDSQAAGYFRALRAARFGGGGGAPAPSQRRGLRRELARGLGIAGRLRALWALPPRPTLRAGRSRAL